MTVMKWMCGVSTCALLAASPVHAADPSDIPWSWTGYYVGTHLGSAAIVNDWKSAGSGFEDAVPFAGEFVGGGIAYGVQAGYHCQIGRVVLGLEAEASFADIDGPARCGVGVFVCNATIDALGTIAGRFGYAHERLLVYGKAGAAWAHEKVEMVPTDTTVSTDVWHGDVIRWGWTLGAGFEYALSPGLSAKLEYNYLAFSSDNVGITNQAGAHSSVSLHHDTHLFKVGLNTRLGYPAGSMPAASAAMPIRDWSGWYVGLHAAGVLGRTDWNSATGAIGAMSTLYFPGTDTNEGVALGGQVGFNRQFGQWVIGAEANVSWADIDGYAKCAADLGGSSLTCHTHVETLGTLAGRLGVAYGNFLFYGKAGAAWGRAAYSTVGPNVIQNESTQAGYVVGSGVEYALNSAWSSRLEYSYVDLGSKTISVIDQFGNASDIGIAQQIHLFKMGLNYKIGADATRGVDAYAQAFPQSKPQPSDWLVEAGARYWFSSGRQQEDLYAETLGGTLNSRLIFGGMDGHSGEAFVRADHKSGFFLKANFGAGVLVNGTLHDEDFPPGTSPYSNTRHNIKDSGLRYGSLDIGYNLIDNPAGRLGVFTGYRYFHQRARGFGCTQIATGDICVDLAGIPDLGLTETEEWRGAAVGANARLALSQRLSLDIEAAFLPYVNRAGIDNHWWRADINPGPETGRGWGTQVEAVLSYAVTERLNVGIGGRYWYMTTTDAGTQFPAAPDLQPMKFNTDRYGGFLQASYKIGGPDLRERDTQAKPVDWTGLYVGAHLGAGFGRSDWADPFPPPPTGDRVLMGGVLGGLNIGYNQQAGRIVLGLDLTGSLGHVEGTETCFGGIAPGTMAGLHCENRISSLGALTGRIGYAFDQSLLYAKAGGAVADQRYTLNSLAVPDGGVSTDKATNWGWTVGGGIEHALTSRWSVNLEYQYFDFGTDTVSLTVPNAIAAVASERIGTQLHVTKMGVNYRFP